MEKIFTSSTASTPPREQPGPSFKNAITLIHLRTSTGRGMIISTDLEISRGTSGSATTSFTSKSDPALNFYLKAFSVYSRAD